jgi:glutamate racemase
MGKNCRVLDSPSIVAEKLVDYLQRHPEIETRLTRNRTRVFRTTDDPERFRSFGQDFLGQRIVEVAAVELKD